MQAVDGARDVDAVALPLEQPVRALGELQLELPEQNPQRRRHPVDEALVARPPVVVGHARHAHAHGAVRKDAAAVERGLDDLPLDAGEPVLAEHFGHVHHLP